MFVYNCQTQLGWIFFIMFCDLHTALFGLLWGHCDTCTRSRIAEIKFGRIIATVLRPVLAWRAFWNLRTADKWNLGYWFSGYGGTTVLVTLSLLHPYPSFHPPPIVCNLSYWHTPFPQHTFTISMRVQKILDSVDYIFARATETFVQTGFLRSELSGSRHFEGTWKNDCSWSFDPEDGDTAVLRNAENYRAPHVPEDLNAQLHSDRITFRFAHVPSSLIV
jgi:hypothetical protein